MLKYVPEADTFCLTLIDDKPIVYMFERLRGEIYIYHHNELVNSTAEQCILPTIAGNKARFTLHEQQGADLAIEAQVKLRFLSKKILTQQ